MNATYTALTFTVSQYGAYSMVSDVLEQQGFADPKDAFDGDEEMAKAVAKWEDHFGIKRPAPFTSFDLEPGGINYITLRGTLEIKDKLPILETMVGSLAMPAKDVLKELGYEDPEVLKQQRMDEDGR